MALEIRSSDRQPRVLTVGAVTARALIIGVLLLVLADLYINWGTLVLRASKLNKSYFPMGLFFPFVVLVLANAGVHRFGLRALSTGELRVILGRQLSYTAGRSGRVRTQMPREAERGP